MSQEKPRAKQPYIVPELTSYGSLQRQQGERKCRQMPASPM